MSIKIYTAPQCQHSILAKRFFNLHEIEYEEVHVMFDKAGYEEMCEKSHQSAVPVIEIGNHIFAGFDKKGILDALREV